MYGFRPSPPPSPLQAPSSTSGSPSPARTPRSPGQQKHTTPQGTERGIKNTKTRDKSPVVSDLHNFYTWRLRQGPPAVAIDRSKPAYKRTRRTTSTSRHKVRLPTGPDLSREEKQGRHTPADNKVVQLLRSLFSLLFSCSSLCDKVGGRYMCRCSLGVLMMDDDQPRR